MTDTATTTPEAESKELRSQMYKHVDIVAWLTEGGFITPESSQAEVIAAFAAKRNEYRRTERYQALVAAGDPANAEREAARAAKAEAAAAAKAEKAAAKEQAAKDKAEAKAAADAEKAAKAEAAKAPAEPAKATKKGKGKAAAETPATEDGEDPFA